MRRILLALITLACVAPAAEAARRDERGRETASRAVQQAPKPVQAKAAPAARPVAAPARTTAQAGRNAAPSRQQATRQASIREAPGRQASTRQAAAGQAGSRQASARQQPSRVLQRDAMLRQGDVRTSRSGLVVRGAAAATVSREAVASCTRRNGRLTCAPARDSVAGWQSGLPTVSYAQRECPEGTFATLARGHDDVVRCMPF